MTRVEITLGLLAVVATIAVTAIVGVTEEARMAKASRGWDVRHVESGAQMFDLYCQNCHGPNAVGLNCPPLDAASGLHGGDLGPGIAWRLEELGWNPALAYEYVYSVIATGRTISTRPERYPGNRVPAPAPGAGTPTPEQTSVPPMAMPPWSQDYGGPLRPDQIRDLASYLVAFRDVIPKTPTVALATAEAQREAMGSGAGAAAGTPEPAGTPTVVPTLPALAPGEAQAGDALFTGLGCVACHSLPDVSTTTLGPDLAGIGARAAQRVAGAGYTGSATTGPGYIHESLRYPSAYTVEGFAKGVMPIFGPDRLTDDDLADLIAYLVEQGG